MMIYLKFVMAGQFYGLEYHKIIEIVPWVALKQIIGAPEYVPGFLNYRGQVVPVVDLTMMSTGTRSARLISSRIVVIHYGETRRLGVLMENATEIITLDDAGEKWHDVGIKTGCGYLGDVSLSEKDTLRLVNVDQLLTEEVKAIIFKD